MSTTCTLSFRRTYMRSFLLYLFLLNLLSWGYGTQARPFFFPFLSVACDSVCVGHLCNQSSPTQVHIFFCLARSFVADFRVTPFRTLPFQRTYSRSDFDSFLFLPMRVTTQARHFFIFYFYFLTHDFVRADHFCNQGLHTQVHIFFFVLFLPCFALTSCTLSSHRTYPHAFFSVLLLAQAQTCLARTFFLLWPTSAHVGQLCNQGTRTTFLSFHVFLPLTPPLNLRFLFLQRANDKGKAPESGGAQPQSTASRGPTYVIFFPSETLSRTRTLTRSLYSASFSPLPLPRILIL